MTRIKKLLIGILLGISLSTIPFYKAEATVSNTATSVTSALGNSSNQNFTVTFTFQDNDDLQVWLQDESTVPYTRTQIVFGVGAGKYTVTGGDPGTTVVMGTAPNSSQRVIIKRISAFTQSVDYSETEAFPAEDHEEAMDKNILLLQQINADLSIRPGYSVTSAVGGTFLPDPYASRLLGYNSTGSNFTLYPSTSSSLASGDVLSFDGTNWVNSASLSGSIAGLASHIANTSNPHSVTAAQVGSNIAQWNASSLQGNPISATSPSSTDVLAWNGSAWAPAAAGGGGAPNVSLATGILPSANGGTGINNSGTLTYGSNNITLSTSGVTSLTLPSSGTVATLSGAEVLTNKTFADAITGAQISTPANPASGFNKLYFKNDDNLYTLTSSGTEAVVGSGSSGAVARFQIGASTANYVVINNASGRLSEEQRLAVSRGGTGQDFSASTGLLKDTAGTFTVATLVNADVAAGASISRNKIESNFGSAYYAVVNDSTGQLSGVAPGTSGNVLKSDGTQWVSGTATVGASVVYWSGYHDNTCIWPRANTSYGDPTADSTCVFSEVYNSGFGTVTSYKSGSDFLPGIVFTPTSVGGYFMCAYMPLINDNLGATVDARLTDGTKIISEGTIHENVINNQNALTLCGIWIATSTTSKTIRIEIKDSAGTSNIKTYTTAPAVSWSIFSIGHN